MADKHYNGEDTTIIQSPALKFFGQFFCQLSLVIRVGEHLMVKVVRIIKDWVTARQGHKVW